MKTLALLFALALSAYAQTAPANIITVTGDAEVKVAPDQVAISLGVESRDPILAAAKDKNDRAVRSVLVAIGKFGIAPADVQTGFINVDLSYVRNDGFTVDYYQVEKSIEVTLRDVSKFEDVLTAVLAAGANHIYGVDFRNSELRKYRDQARALAVKAATEKAAQLAAAAGLKAGKATGITSYSSGSLYGRFGRGSFQNVSQNISQVGEGPDPEGTIALGKISVTASVTMTFRLE